MHSEKPYDTLCETELRLRLLDTDAGDLPRLPVWSSRGVIQSLMPLRQPSLSRTIDGRLIDLSAPWERKYRSRVTCRDKRPAAFEGLWIGAALEVDCVSALYCPLPENARAPISLARTPVPGSVVLETEDGDLIALAPKGTQVSLPPHTPGHFLVYRPRLSMRLTHFSSETDEWGLDVGWDMELEEM